MIDEYVKRVTAQGIPGGKIVADAMALKKKNERQHK
jgi:hypothetical protein